MRAILTLTVAALVLASPAGAANGTPTSPLARYGYHLYGEYCLGCHGGNAEGRYKAPSTGTGAGPGREQGQQGGVGPSLRGVGALAADFYLRTGYMPLRQVGLQPQRSRVLFSDRQIRALVAYIATFGGPGIPKPNPARGSVSEGLHLFTEHCAGCHQVLAQGGLVTGATPPPLIAGDANAVQIAQAVRLGPYVMPKFSKEAISDHQLDSIIAYVLYAQHPAHPGGWGLDFLGPVPEGLVTWFLAIPVLILLCLAVGRRLAR